MNCFKDEMDNIKQHFEEKNWIYDFNEKGIVFHKKSAFLPNGEIVISPSKRVINDSFAVVFNQFFDITSKFAHDKIGNCKILNPINIYNAYKNNSFVSTGLEYYYNYLYNNGQISSDKSIILQPSIRFKLDFFNNALYGNNNKYDFSSISFNNLSIVHFEEKLDIIKNIENVLDYLSMLKIHASRVNFVVETTVRQKENNVSYIAIKFFVDNLEVGDILFFNAKDRYLVEYGFGFERLLSRILNKKYCDLFISNNKYDIRALLASNFLTSLCMFDNRSCNHGAKSKINMVLKTFDKNNDIMDLSLVYENYLYWNQILQNTTYNANFDNVAKKYIKLLRR